MNTHNSSQGFLMGSFIGLLIFLLLVWIWLSIFSFELINPQNYVVYSWYRLHEFVSYPAHGWSNLPWQLRYAIYSAGFSTLLLMIATSRMGGIKRLNRRASFFANSRDLRKFKAPTPRVTEKSGIVLGVFNTGLIPHRWFLGNSLTRRLMNTIKNTPILNILVNYKILKTSAPLSGMCVAPAGTGKTAGVVFPSVISCDDDCLVINDPKGEIRDLTRNYREGLAKYDNTSKKQYQYTFNLEWKSSNSSKWNPFNYSFFYELDNTPDFFIRVNETATRAANILIEDTGGDKFWINSARELFATLAQYLILVKYFSGEATNISEIKDTATQLNSAITKSEKDVGDKTNDENAVIKYKIDGYIEYLESSLSEIIAERNYSEEFLKMFDTATSKVVVGLRGLSSLPSKTRESIIQTLKSGMAIFDNPLVVANTSENTIDYRAIREGINGKPVTVYMVVPASEQKSYGVLNGLFVEFLYQYMVSSGEPKKTDKTIRVILDEVAFFPAISAISDAPAITRSFRISWLFVCQDLEQFRTNWGEKGLQNMLTNTAFKIILSQNNERSASMVVNSIGETEARLRNDRKEQARIERTKLISSAEIMSLVNEQIVIVQTKANRPIKCEQSFWFKYSEFRRKVRRA